MSYNKSYPSSTTNTEQTKMGPYFDNDNSSSINRIISDPRYEQIINVDNIVSKSKKSTSNPIDNTNQIKQTNQTKQTKQTKDQVKSKINSFKIINFGKVSNRTDYLADVGLISPPYVITDQFQILSFDQINSDMKQYIIDLLNEEFGQTNDVYYSEDFINNTWSGANVFYVMTSSDRSKLYGTIAVDRKNFYPYISQLYIVEEERSRNLAKHLINFANRYIKSLNFTQSRLWCENKLVSYYTNLGWYFEGKENDLNIMVFNL